MVLGYWMLTVVSTRYHTQVDLLCIVDVCVPIPLVSFSLFSSKFLPGGTNLGREKKIETKNIKSGIGSIMKQKKSAGIYNLIENSCQVYQS